MTASEKNEDQAGDQAARPPAGGREGRGWLRRNYTLVVILVVPVAIGLSALGVMKVRKVEPPTAADLAYWAGQRFVSEGQYLEALYHLGVATLADPDRLDAALLRARLRLSASDEALAQVRADLEKRLEAASREASAGREGVGALHALLALAYRDSDAGRAAEHEARAAEHEARTAAAFYHRAVAMPRAEEAYSLLTRGLSIDADHVPSLKASALDLHRRGRFEAMFSVLRRAGEERPGDASTLSLITLALRSRGDPDAALALHEAVVELRPDDPETYRQRSLTHLLRRDFVKAAADARRAAQLAPPGLLRFYRMHLLEMLVAADELEEVEEEFLEAPAETTLEDWILRGVAERASFEEFAAGRELEVPAGRESLPLFQAMLETGRLARTLGDRGRRLARQSFGASFSPDGKRLVYARGVPGASRIEVLDLESGGVSTPGPDGRDPAWSPDGSLVAFVRQGEAVEWTELTRIAGRSPGIRRGEEVWLMTPEGRDVRRLIAGGAPAWSRDSKRVYFHQGTLLKSVAIDPDHPAEVTHFSLSSPLPPSVSPDEMLVATHVRDDKRNELHVIRLDTGAATQRWFSPRWNAKGLTAAWSHNGRELAVSGLPGDGLGLWIFNMESRNISRVLAGDSVGAVWSPDGSMLALEIGAPFWDLWSLPLDRARWTDETLGKVEKVEDFLEGEVERLTEAIAAKPDDYESYRQRARLHDRLNRFDEAVADYQKAAEGLDDKAVLYYRSARVRHREGRLRDAADAYARAIELDPTMPGSYIQRALLYTRVGEHAAALADYEQLIKLTEEFGKYRHLAAKLCIDGGDQVYDPGRAVLLMEKAIELEPENVEYRLTLGQAYWLLDDPRSAIDAMEAAVRLADVDSREQVHGTLSWWYVMAPEGVRDPDRAMTHARTARDAASKKTWPVYENHIGMAHYRKGDFPLAEVVLNRALRQDSAGGNAYHFFCLAMCNQRLGRVEKARQYLERALEWTERKTPRGAYQRQELAVLESEARAVLESHGSTGEGGEK